MQENMTKRAFHLFFFSVFSSFACLLLLIQHTCNICKYCYISVDIPFPSELEPETIQGMSVATSPITESGEKPSIQKEDSTLAEMDKELDILEIEGRQNRKNTASACEEAAVVMEEVEKLKQKKEILLDEIKKKERELGYFEKLHSQHHLVDQHEKEDLQESITAKENELREAKARLKKYEKRLEKSEEKICSLKRKIEEGARELVKCDVRINELEKSKAKLIVHLESERMKVRVHHHHLNL